MVDYTPCDPHPTAPKPNVQATQIDLASLAEAGAIRHAFATWGPKAKPLRVDVNGRKGRRAICVLYGDAMRYDVLDLDAAIEHEEEDMEG